MSDHTNRIIVEEGKHSKRGASSAHRWLPCPGSINLTERLEEEGHKVNRTSVPAAEGTAAHLVLSTCLEDGTDAIDMAGFSIVVADWTFQVDEDMVEHVQESIDWVRATVAKAKAEGHEVHLYVERNLDSFMDEDAYGTADVIIYVVGVRLIVADFKYGKGVTVEPDSIQNRYYGALACENYLTGDEGDLPVESYIMQPRIPHPCGTIRGYKTNLKEITKWWTGVVIPGINETRNPNALLTIGEHCRFCPAKSHCPALKREAFEIPEEIDPSHLSDEEIGTLLTKFDALKSMVKLIEGEAFRRARQGLTIPGYKVVRKKSNRTWRDSMAVRDPENDVMVEVDFEEAVRQAFGDDAYTTPKVKTPPGIEKLEGGKDFANQWSFKPDTGLTLAKLSDKRTEAKPALERFMAMQNKG